MNKEDKCLTGLLNRYELTMVDDNWKRIEHRSVLIYHANYILLRLKYEYRWIGCPYNEHCDNFSDCEQHWVDYMERHDCSPAVQKGVTYGREG